jgi:hypothetical protein
LDGALALALEKLPDDIDRARVVSGIVTQDDVPVAGALVQPHGAKTSSRRWWGRVEGVDPTVTDEKGYFEMVLPKDFLAVDIRITGHGYCGEQIDLLEPGSDPVTIEVRKGAGVTGRLVHQGQPVPGMSVAVVQLERGVTDGIFIAAVGDVTNDSGEFEFHFLPPDQRYCIYSVDRWISTGWHLRTRHRHRHGKTYGIRAGRRFAKPGGRSCRVGVACCAQ